MHIIYKLNVLVKPERAIYFAYGIGQTLQREIQALKKPDSSRATAFGKRDQPPGNFQFPRRAAGRCNSLQCGQCVQDKEARMQMRELT